MQWDPRQYGRFAEQRSRPFFDLVAQIGADAPDLVVDLGCGPGTMTETLAWRWPDARIEGIDSSPDMIAAAAADSGIAFRVGEIESWEPTGDVVIANAALQWVPSHPELIKQWCAALRPGSWLAWQVPANSGSPSHQLLYDLAESPRWRSALDGVPRSDSVLSPDQYADLLIGAGWSADVWETTYSHVLDGPDPVLEWTRGTSLRPITQALGPDAHEFEAAYAAQLREAYPAGPAGTLFAFRRIFAVGHRPS